MPLNATEAVFGIYEKTTSLRSWFTASSTWGTKLRPKRLRSL